jgi:hypothetical protein
MMKVQCWVEMMGIFNLFLVGMFFRLTDVLRVVSLRCITGRRNYYFLAINLFLLMPLVFSVMAYILLFAGFIRFSLARCSIISSFLGRLIRFFDH